MRTDIFMWILTALGGAVMFYMLVKMAYGTSAEDSEQAEQEDSYSPAGGDERSIRAGASDAEEMDEADEPNTRPFVDLYYLEDSIRLAKSLARHWRLFLAAGAILALSTFVIMLIANKGDLGESINLLSSVKYRLDYSGFLMYQTFGFFTGISKVYGAVMSVAGYPLALFVAFDLYSLRRHPDGTVSKVAGRYFTLILLGLIPWALPYLIFGSVRIVGAPDIPIYLELLQTVMVIGQNVLGMVAASIAEGYLFGYAYAFLSGRGDAHRSAIKLAIDRFAPLFTYNMLWLVFVLSLGILFRIMMRAPEDFHSKFFMRAEYVGAILMAGLLTVPPFIVAGNRNVIGSFKGAIGAIIRNPRGYAALVSIICAVLFVFNVTRGTLSDYILHAVFSPAVYAVLSSFIVPLMKIAGSGICMCIIAAYFMRYVHVERGKEPSTSTPG